jgi:hypothetical protein
MLAINKYHFAFFQGKKAALAALKAKAAKSVNAAPDDVEEQHIYNIFKGKPDPELKPDHW